MFTAGTKVTYQLNKTIRGNAVISSKSTAKRTPHYYILTETEGTILVPATELEVQS